MPGYLVAKPIELQERKTSSGIVIPRGEKVRGRLEETQQGEIIAIKQDFDSPVEDGKTAPDWFLNVGDHIIYGEYAGFESDIEGQRYRFLKIEDVRAKIT